MVKVTMVTTPDDGSCGIGTYAGNLMRAFPSSVDVSTELFERDDRDPLAFLRLAIRAGTSDSDVVHVQHEYGFFGPKSLYSWFFFPLLWLSTRLSGARLVVTMHSAWNSRTIDPPLVALKRVYVAANNRLLAATADELVFLSEACKDDFRLSVPLDHYRVFPFGVQSDTIDIGENEAKRTFGYDPDDTVIVELGFIRPEKGNEEFVELARRLPEYSFMLAGGPPDGGEEYYRSVTADVPENLTVTGRLDDDEFDAAIVAADLAVLPYKQMSQSEVFNYCVAYGCPVAGSDRPYFRRLADEYGCVELFDPDDVTDIRQTVEELLADESRRAELASAMATFRENVSFEAVGRRHEELYEERAA
jgi:glycosyltransferase involved in cell wall biosynthesis